MTFGKPKRYKVQTLPDASVLVLDQVDRNITIAREILNHFRFEKYAVFSPQKREELAKLASLIEDTIELENNVWDIEQLPQE